MKIKGGYQILDLTSITLPLSGMVNLEENLDKKTLKIIEDILYPKGKLPKSVKVLIPYNVSAYGSSLSPCLFDTILRFAVDSQECYEEVGFVSEIVIPNGRVSYTITDLKYENDGVRTLVLRLNA